MEPRFPTQSLQTSLTPWLFSQVRPILPLTCKTIIPVLKASKFVVICHNSTGNQQSVYMWEGGWRGCHAIEETLRREGKEGRKEEDGELSFCLPDGLGPGASFLW